MKMLYNLVQKVAQRHAINFTTVVNRQIEPKLYDAIMNKLDNKLSLFISGAGSKVNPEAEIMQDLCFDTMGLGMIDNGLDILKYCLCAIKTAKYKATPYIAEYRNSLEKNIEAILDSKKPHWREFIFDFSKKEIPASEVNAKMRKIFT